MPTARFAFEATPADVHRTRGRISAAVRSWGVPFDEQLRLRLELVASELLTNGLVHAGGRLTAEVTLSEPFLVLEVHDGSPVMPRRRDARADDERGRGLAWVEACCLLSGAETTDGGKRCFAVLSLSADDTRDAPAQPPRSPAGDAAASARWTLTPTALRLLPHLFTDGHPSTQEDTDDARRPRRARA